MGHNERNLSAEMREREINMQINAVARAIELLGENAPTNVDDVIGLLAYAETEAQFMCGFVLLNESDDVKSSLADELFQRGFITLQDEKLKLTDAGKERAAVALPGPIEEVLR